MTKKIEKEWVTWCDIEYYSANLYRKIKKYNIGLIVGVTRGGLIPAVMLSNMFGEYHFIAWTPTENSSIDRILLTNIKSTLSNGEKVLFVDYIFDSGDTLNYAVNFLKDNLPRQYVRGNETNIIISALYCREKSKLSIPSSMSAVKMVYSKIVRHSGDLVFPWEE